MNDIQQLPLELKSGVELAGYTLDSRIGSGSSGEVWRAYSDSSVVAIKVMQEALLRSDKRAVHLRRFRAEVEALNLMALEPRVPDLYTVSLDTLPPFFVMSLVEGRSFAEDIATGQMMLRPVHERLERLEEVAMTLDAIHTLGLIHRDIKPSNIRGWDRPFLLDFSISLTLDSAKSANPKVGTRFYMPPYPYAFPSIFSDIYAFALVCYEVLFGRHALFSVEEHIQDIQSSGLDKLQQKRWYRPSKMSAAELPIYLRGANLRGLDAVFQEAFTNQQPTGNAKSLVKLLAEMIDVPNNEGYIHRLPNITPLASSDSVLSEVFTDHEVDMHALNTDLDIKDTFFVARKLLFFFAVGAVFLILIMWIIIHS